MLKSLLSADSFSVTSAVLLPDMDFSSVQKIWHADLIKLTNCDIKLSNIVIALTALLIGAKCSNQIVYIVTGFISKKINNDKNTINTLEKIVKYITFTMLILIVLQIANIPLSAFAFIGGAVAIGLGLGAQQIANNFICSIIIMTEQPIKIGDIIETQGIIGKVKEIGGRCVILVTFDSEEILIPNGQLIEQKLSKWPSSDQKIEYSINVHVIKSTDSKIDHLAIIEQLSRAGKEIKIGSESIEPTIWLNKIGKTKDEFHLKFSGNIDMIQNMEEVKHQLNFALIAYLKADFYVVYPKNLI